MKLHLPKKMFAALMASMSVISSTAWAGSGLYNNFSCLLGGTAAGGGVSQSQYSNITETTPEGGKLTTTVDKIDVSSLGEFDVWADSNGNAWTNALVKELLVGNNAKIKVSESQWKAGDALRYFDSLHIQNLNINGGKAELNVTLANHIVTVDAVNGTLSSVNNAGTLTIGTSDSTTYIGGTLANTGTLTFKGSISISSLEGFTEKMAGSVSWSDATNSQGFKTTQGATYYLSTGNVTFSDYDTEEMLIADADSNTYAVSVADGDATFTAGTVTSTIYVVNSGYTKAVEYNGTSGDTAGATGFELGNGTTVKLTGNDFSGLTDRIKIAAGDGGQATVSIANGVSQTYASLSLGSLVTKESGSYVLNIDGTGTVVTTNHNSTNGYGFHTGEISITNGGKLIMEQTDGLGYDGNATSKISILNGTLALGARQTFSTDLDMKGGAIVATHTTTVPGSDGPKIDVWSGMNWTVSGIGNEVQAGVAVNMRKDVTINVAAAGELSIKGAFENSGQLTKAGEGKLVLDGVAKTLNGQLQMTGGTLQLGGTADSDGLVTLAGGINHTAGTVQVAGKAAITGDSVLGGALVVDSTGNLTLGKTYTLTGSLSIAEGGKLIGATGMTVGESTAPAAGTNGWDSSIVTVLQTADDNVSNISGLTKIQWTDGNAYDISSSSSEGVTSYTASVGVNYYVQDTTTKAEYSTESGLTRAGVIYMSDDTTLVVKENMSTNKVSVAEGAAVNYEVDGAQLSLDSLSNTNIESISVTNSGTAYLTGPTAKLGASGAYVTINLSEGGKFAFDNGNGNGANIYANVNIDGTGELIGSYYGNSANIHGTVSGTDNSLLKLTPRSGSTNSWKISGKIQGNMAIESGTYVELTGANTYSGGTTVNGGTLTAGNESALGTGKVTVNGGTLKQSTALSVSSMDYNSGTVNNNGQNLTVTGKLTAAADMSIEGAGATSIGSLDLSAGTTLTAAGSLTIGELVLDLSKYTDLAQTYTLVTTTGEGATVGLSTAYSAEYKGYTASVSGSGTDSLTLSFSEIVAPSGEITTTVTGQSGFADGMLTLNVAADLTDATQVLISGISDSIMAEILGLSGLPENGMVGITLAGADGTTFTAEADQQIGFQGKDGVSTYFGENVDGNWVYQVAYIPEPASATLGLAALMMLCARRRRKA